MAIFAVSFHLILERGVSDQARRAYILSASHSLTIGKLPESSLCGAVLIWPLLRFHLFGVT